MTEGELHAMVLDTEALCKRTANEALLAARVYQLIAEVRRQQSEITKLRALLAEALGQTDKTGAEVWARIRQAAGLSGGET